jgi:hypothetical protein
MPLIEAPSANPAARPEFVQVRPSVSNFEGTSRWVSEKVQIKVGEMKHPESVAARISKRGEVMKARGETTIARTSVV